MILLRHPVRSVRILLLLRRELRGLTLQQKIARLQAIRAVLETRATLAWPDVRR